MSPRPSGAAKQQAAVQPSSPSGLRSVKVRVKPGKVYFDNKVRHREGAVVTLQIPQGKSVGKDVLLWAEEIGRATKPEPVSEEGSSSSAGDEASGAVI